MKIHYISCHSILEYDEVKLFTEMGHEVFSNGAYLDPRGHITLPRPGIDGALFYEEYANLAVQHPKTNLPDELIDPFDVIIVMHQPNVVINNWEKLKNKKVIWRSIGQSTQEVESMLNDFRRDGLHIVRYSPNEFYIPNFTGSDAMIRFYKDEDELSGWNGSENNVISFAQSLKGRRDHCHYDEISSVVSYYNGRIYGPGNDDLGALNGGAIPYYLQIEKMQKAGAMIYGGTAPAPYTLSFIEALVMGLPIVAIGNSIANIIYGFPFYEVQSILDEINGIVCNSSESMIHETFKLLNDQEYARNLSKKQREIGIELFGKQKIKKQWEDFLNAI